MAWVQTNYLPPHSKSTAHLLTVNTNNIQGIQKESCNDSQNTQHDWWMWEKQRGSSR